MLVVGAAPAKLRYALLLWMSSRTDLAVRLLLHVEGDAFSVVEQRLLKDFEGTMRALGHMVDRHHHVDQPLPSRIVWIVHDVNDRGAETDTIERVATYTRLRSLCACIDLAYIHGDFPHVQDTYDRLLELTWHESAYCFAVPQGDVQLLAKVFATLLSDPAQRRLPQEEAEQLMRIF